MILMCKSVDKEWVVDTDKLTLEEIQKQGLDPLGTIADNRSVIQEWTTAVSGLDIDTKTKLHPVLDIIGEKLNLK